MKHQYLLYSVKVWMGSVLGAPYLFFAIGFFTTKHSNNYMDLIPACMLFSFFEMLFSLLTWLMFWMLIELLVVLVMNKALQKCLASLIGISLTCLTFKIFPFFDSFDTTNNDYLLMLCNCACIGAGALYFDLGKSQRRQVNIAKPNYDEE